MWSPLPPPFTPNEHNVKNVTPNTLMRDQFRVGNDRRFKTPKTAIRSA